jgi:hypothetical protein
VVFLLGLQKTSPHWMTSSVFCVLSPFFQKRERTIKRGGMRENGERETDGAFALEVLSLKILINFSHPNPVCSISACFWGLLKKRTG